MVDFPHMVVRRELLRTVGYPRTPTQGESRGTETGRIIRARAAQRQETVLRYRSTSREMSTFGVPFLGPSPVRSSETDSHIASCRRHKTQDASSVNRLERAEKHSHDIPPPESGELVELQQTIQRDVKERRSRSIQASNSRYDLRR